MIRLLGEGHRKQHEQWIVFWLNRCAELNGGCEECERVIDCTKQYDSLMNAFYRFQGKQVSDEYAREHTEFLKRTMEIK